MKKKLAAVTIERNDAWMELRVAQGQVSVLKDKVSLREAEAAISNQRAIDIVETLREVNDKKDVITGERDTLKIIVFRVMNLVDHYKRRPGGRTDIDLHCVSELDAVVGSIVSGKLLAERDDYRDRYINAARDLAAPKG